MFGVNKDGEDTLSYQFSQGGRQGNEDSARATERHLGSPDRLAQQWIDYLKRDRIGEITEDARASLISAGVVNPGERTLNDAIEAELKRRALMIVERHEQEQRKNASRNAILRHGGTS